MRSSASPTITLWPLCRSGLSTSILLQSIILRSININYYLLRLCDTNTSARHYSQTGTAVFVYLLYDTWVAGSPSIWYDMICYVRKRETREGSVSVCSLENWTAVWEVEVLDTRAILRAWIKRISADSSMCCVDALLVSYETSVMSRWRMTSLKILLLWLYLYEYFIIISWRKKKNEHPPRAGPWTLWYEDTYYYWYHLSHFHGITRKLSLVFGATNTDCCCETNFFWLCVWLIY